MLDTSVEHRVLALLPNRTDAEHTIAFLAEVGVACTACASMTELVRAISHGVGAVLVTEEALLRDSGGTLRQALGAQPEWSAVALIVLARETTDARVGTALVDVLADV